MSTTKIEKYKESYLDKRNAGLGTLLFERLQSEYKLEKLQTAFDSTNIAATNFTLKCGFQLIRKSYCYDVNKEMLKDMNNKISGEFIILNDLSKDKLNDAIILQYEDYKLNHKKINPLNKDMKIEEWKNIIFDDLVKEDSFLLIKDNDIHAYLLSYESDDTSIMVGYTGNRCSNIKDYKAFLYEVIIQLFSYKPNISWDTYVKDNWFHIKKNYYTNLKKRNKSLKRSDKEEHAPGILSMVGGKVETRTAENDILEENLKREIMEEVGIEVSEELHYVESNSFISDKGQVVINIVFLCKYQSGEPKCISVDEVSEVYWMSCTEVLENKNTPVWLKKSIEKVERFRLKNEVKTTKIIE